MRLPRHVLALTAVAIGALILPASLLGAAGAPTTDVVVYGATAGGVAAAVQVARMGKHVVLVEPSKHVGGLTSGGLGNTDSGAIRSIGGIAREFYGRVRDFYSVTYGPASAQLTDCRGGYRFEPHVAEAVLERLLGEAKVEVWRERQLTDVVKRGRHLAEVGFSDGTRVAAAQFVDCSYEGDLMALAKVGYHVGREGNATYGETLNGRQFLHGHNFRLPIDPYVKPGDPTSGLLWGISAEPPGTAGEGDAAVQAYNFRMCLTKAADRLPLPKPDSYDPQHYELLLRYIQAGAWDALKLTSWLPNGKTDTNNCGGFSTDFIGGNSDYPDADWAWRRKIIAEHVTYQQGLMWFLANDPRVPPAIHEEVSTWGLPRDEFVDNGGWPTQLYIREARRMVAATVMTEHHCRGKVVATDGVGLASYGMDSHNCRRLVINGVVRNEGNVEAHGFPPYPVSFAALVPKETECDNLAVPVCLSASHIAYGSIRMEPVFMILGQSAATAACQAIDQGCAVQRVDFARLRARLLADQQVLDWVPSATDDVTKVAAIAAKSLPGIVLDDADGVRTGPWTASTVAGNRLMGTGYFHDGDGNKGQASIRWKLTVPTAGRYEVALLAPYNPNRASRVPVTLAVAGRPPVTVYVNQRDPAAKGRVVVGVFDLPAGQEILVTVSNRDTDGYVVADGLQFVPQNDPTAAGKAP